MEKELLEQMKQEMLVKFTELTCGNPKCDPAKRAIDMNNDILRYQSCCPEYADIAEKALAPIKKKYQNLDQS